MKTTNLLMWSVCLWLAAGAAVLYWAESAEADSANSQLPIHKVILYKHGVGYFQRAGTVTDNASVDLRFKRDQMSDLLKSLTAIDLGGGSVTGIVYDSTKTLEQLLGEYTFDLRGANSLGDILQQLKGSDVAIEIAAKEITGSVLGVQQRTITDEQGHIQVSYLSMLDSQGRLRSFNMDEITAVRFMEDRLNRDVQRYLRTLFGRHRRDQKTLTIQSAGSGSRELLVGYVTETPVWKATYRIVLPGDDDEEALFLQGWAIVDNVSEEDWSDVELSLVSGLPISFVQNLYDPLFKKRPVVAVEEEMAMAPVVPQKNFLAGVRSDAIDRMAKAKRRAKGAVRAEAEAPLLGDTPVLGAEVKDFFFRQPVDLAEQMRDLEAQSVARELGDMFEYRIDHPVSIAQNRSALLPIVADDIDGEAVALYNAATRPKNPLSAVRLKNTTGLTLEGGAITVYQSDSYVGEALAETIKPDEQRYITYAVDLGLHVNTKHDSKTEPIERVVINRGTMWFHRSVIETKTYNLDNKDDREKTVVIEHPYHADWKLLGQNEPIEVTDDYRRFEVNAAAKQLTKYPVRERRDTRESLAVGNVTPELLAVYVRQKYLTDATKRQLDKIVTIKEQIVAIDRETKALEAERDRIFQDQERLRRNLNSLRNTTEEKDLRSRYLKQLTEQETRLDDIHNRLNDLQETRRSKQEQLDQLIETMQQDLMV